MLDLKREKREHGCYSKELVIGDGLCFFLIIFTSSSTNGVKVSKVIRDKNYVSFVI